MDDSRLTPGELRAETDPASRAITEQMLGNLRLASARAANGIECVECGLVDDGRRGWRSYLTVDDATAIYCPACAAREFDSL